MSSKTEALMHDWGDLALREASASSAAMAEAVDARDAEDRENIFPRDGFSEVICIPSPNLTPEERELWRRVRARTILRLPAESPGELLIRETRRVLCLMGYGKKVTIPALFAGINLALAKTMGVRIRTPLRGIARDVGIRYSTLLLVRRTALSQIARLGPVLEMGIELSERPE